MKKLFTLCILISVVLLTSCEKYDEYVLPVVGTYEANVLGLAGPFSLTVSIDFGRDILIDAPFDGYEWFVAEAKVKDKEEYRKRIIIKDQRLDDGIYIEGEGIYYEGTIQLDYTLEIEGYEYDYTIVGTKY